ncbi:hypothetical protein Lser_V15G04087 [Lactuca serriola]
MILSSKGAPTPSHFRSDIQVMTAMSSLLGDVALEKATYNCPCAKIG